MVTIGEVDRSTVGWEVGGLPNPEGLPSRIEPLEDVFRYIDLIDFHEMKAKNESSENGGLGWTSVKLDFVERQYKKWLFLRRKWEGVPMPPGSDIDDFWHCHILDTHAYHRDTAAVFGYYLHHFPYFGARGDSDLKDLYEAYETTKLRYMEEFGEEIYAYDEEEEDEE